MKYQVDEKGFYGDFGGAYIPEMLYPNVEELRQNYIKISDSVSFQKEFHPMLFTSSCTVSACLIIKHTI